MRIGINTLLWTAAFGEEHLDLLPQFRDWGFDGVEIARFDFDRFPASKIRGALERADLQCTFCSALTGETSLISSDASVRSGALEFLKRGIRTTAELGAKVFVGPFCSPVGKLTGQRATEDEWKYAVEGFQALGEELDACDVILAHEALNRFETYFGNLSGEAYRLCQEAGHPRLGIVLDTFHANIEEKDTASTIRAVASRLHHVHSCESDRGIPGTGQVHWDTVLPALKESGYNGWLVIESFGSRIPEIAAAACIWRDVAPSAESIAVDGLRFLQSRIVE